MSEALNEFATVNTSEFQAARDKAVDALINLARFDVVPSLSMLDDTTRTLAATGLKALAESLRLDELTRSSN